MVKFKQEQEEAPEAVERIREAVRRAPPFKKPPVIRRVRMTTKKKVKKQGKGSGKQNAAKIKTEARVKYEPRVKNEPAERDPPGPMRGHPELILLKKSFKCRKCRAYHQARTEYLQKGQSHDAAKLIAQSDYKKEAAACKRELAAQRNALDVN